MQSGNRCSADSPEGARPKVEALGAAPAGSAVGWRRVEKLVALYRDEVTAKGGGLELVTETFDWVKDWFIDPPRAVDAPSDSDYTAPELDRIASRAAVIAEILVRGLVSMGAADADEVERFIEATALRRTECDARFNVSRPMPLSEAEQRELAAGWERSLRDNAQLQ